MKSLQHTLQAFFSPKNDLNKDQWQNYGQHTFARTVAQVRQNGSENATPAIAGIRFKKK